jgi:hypothetical protein
VVSPDQARSFAPGRSLTPDQPRVRCPSTTRPRRLLCIAALALFACMDTTTKYLTQTHEVPLIVGVRYLGNLVLMVALLGPTTAGR